MKVCILAIVCLIFFLTIHLRSTSLEEKVRDSIARLTIVIDGEVDSVCTAWSVKANTYITAAHCTPIGATFVLDKEEEATILAIDPKHDLALIQSDYLMPALEIRKEPLRWLEEVEGIGYGGNFRLPIVTFNRVVSMGDKLSPSGPKGTIFMSPFVGGMSGGPVIDSNGKVVGICQQTNSTLGFGVDANTIIKFLGGKTP